MNPQEKTQLEQFLQQLNSTQAGPKDGEANALIMESVKQQPDAAYLLVQRAMGFELALQVAQKQMAEIQAQADQTNKPTGFLSGINAWGRTAPAAVQSTASSNMPAAKSVAAQAQPSSWGTGMLGVIATTAVGVVAGSMLYQGIQNMMGQNTSASVAGEALDQSSVPTDSSQESPQNYDHVASNQDSDFGGEFDSDGFA